VVAIGSPSFASIYVGSVGFVGSMAIGYYIDYAKVVGNSKAIGIIVGYFSQHCSNQIDFVEDLGYYSFFSDYHMNLNFARGLEAYLDVGPMVGIEKQRILTHHLHLS